MPKRLRANSTNLAPVLVAFGLIALVILGYVVHRASSSGQILGSVTVLNTPIGGDSPEEASAALLDLEARLANEAVPVRVQGASVQILPKQTGFDLDEGAIIDRAMAIGRSTNPVSNFVWWITHLGRAVEVEPTGSIDPELYEETLNALDEGVIGEPPFEGGIELQDGELVAEYPRPGLRIDRVASEPILVEMFLSNERSEVELPIRNESPDLTPGDIDAALAEAELMLSAPVVLTADEGTSLTFEVSDLKAAFRARVDGNPATVHLEFDSEPIEAKLNQVRAEFEAAPVDARFQVDGATVSVVPGRYGTLIDAAKSADAIASAARTSLRRAELPLEEGARPEVTTEDLEALDIKHLVSQFTTYHDCCASRVTNIQLFADKVDGAIIAPGETLSLNEYVGRRTAEEGFLPAGTIVGGEIVDTVGGGVSQFATTFYNAVFWGGYEDVTHKPHSFYFSRYPEGIEATISWPQPDLEFRNNDDSGVLVKTEYTDTSITVKFYGNNDGRTLVGNQSGGSLSVQVVSEGGPDAAHIRGDRSDRFDFRSPPSPLYRANSELEVDEEKQVQTPAEGWSVKVTRTITVGDDTTTQEWIVRYLPKREIIEVHPCKVPDSETTCPTTTTTTSSTTTTLPPDTTTTAPPTTAPPTTGGG